MDGRTYAMKIIDRSKCKGKENMIDTEIDILTRVQHENIISMHDAFQIEGKIYLQMELWVSGHFGAVGRRLNEIWFAGLLVASSLTTLSSAASTPRGMPVGLCKRFFLLWTTCTSTVSHTATSRFVWT